MVKARVKYHARISYTVECQRAKYKYWHLIGTHRETDIEFRRALGDGWFSGSVRCSSRSLCFEIYGTERLHGRAAKG